MGQQNFDNVADLDRVWDAIDDIKIAMLVTETEHGPHARPMTAILNREQGLIWFLSGGPSTKEHEIGDDRLVCLTFSDGVRTQVSVTGHASVLHDRAIVRKLWSKDADAFIPSGPDDPNVVAIRVVPHGVELWEGQRQLVKRLAQLIGNKPGDAGDHVRIGMV